MANDSIGRDWTLELMIWACLSATETIELLRIISIGKVIEFLNAMRDIWSIR